LYGHRGRSGSAKLARGVFLSLPKKRGHWQFGIQKVEQVGLLSRHDVLLPLNTQFKAGVREPVNSLPMTLAG
jgi:hypothetical protein